MTAKLTIAQGSKNVAWTFDADSVDRTQSGNGVNMIRTLVTWVAKLVSSDITNLRTRYGISPSVGIFLAYPNLFYTTESEMDVGRYGYDFNVSTNPDWFKTKSFVETQVFAGLLLSSVKIPVPDDYRRIRLLNLLANTTITLPGQMGVLWDNVTFTRTAAMTKTVTLNVQNGLQIRDPNGQLVSSYTISPGAEEYYRLFAQPAYTSDSNFARTRLNVKEYQLKIGLSG